MDLFTLLQSLFSLFANQDLFLKLSIAALLFIYILVAIIVARQIFVLNSIVNQVSFSPVFKILAILHVVFAVLLLLFIIFNL